MGFYLILSKGKEIKRDKDGYPYSWKNGEQIAEFRSAAEFKMYVHKNIKKLKTAVAFSGGASLLAGANGFITDELKKVGLL